MDRDQEEAWYDPVQRLRSMTFAAAENDVRKQTTSEVKVSLRVREPQRTTIYSYDLELPHYSTGQVCDDILWMRMKSSPGELHQYHEAAASGPMVIGRAE